MSTKRLLKKEIRNICGALAGECIIAKCTIEGINPETMNEIVYKIAELQEKSIERISVNFDRTPSSFDNEKEYVKARTAYYKKAFKALKDEFNTEVDAIIKEMNAALPAAAKEANKEAAK
ncbi:MAG: hypothetical protein NC098_04560 [Lachnoclostridium sp.]|nr:hypothetical protein [Lachnoclostridium sp.]